MNNLGFRYPLQKIVDLKTNEKTQAEWILSHAMTVLQEEEQSLHSLHSEKSDIHADLSSAVGVDLRITKKVKDVERAEQNVVHKKGHLSAKMIDEKVWSKAKDKAKMIFEGIERTKEQQILDEMATTRHKFSF